MSERKNEWKPAMVVGVIMCYRNGMMLWKYTVKLISKVKTELWDVSDGVLKNRLIRDMESEEHEIVLKECKIFLKH